MGSLNQVTLLGNVGSDPQVRSLQNGDTITNFTLATSERWTSKQTGQRESRTEWHRIACFGRIADVVRDHVTKGTQLLIQGELRTRKWQDQQGNDRYTTEIQLNNFRGNLQFVGKKDSQEGGGGGGQQTPAQPQAQAQSSYEDEDIPF